jgi:RimJ/RimL family protein N-acetyltransferase
MKTPGTLQGIHRKSALQDIATTVPQSTKINTLRIQTSIPSCLLRPWDPADKSDLVANANNRKIWRNLSGMFPHPYTEADADTWFQIAGESGRSLHFAIEFEGAAIGGTGAIAGEGVFRQTAQYGYWLGEKHWGKGIATAAAQALVAHLESERCFARLEAPVFAWNPASMRVLEKAGFQREGILRNSITKDGQLIDSVLHAYLIE